jgi:serine/threonine-protein kinase
MKSLGRYELLGVLGEGGMGIVYRARDPVTNREVTVKTIRDAQDKAVLDLFKRECAVLASMTHPNIVEIFDIGETDEDGAKRPYFVMPLLPGSTLQALIHAASPRLTVERSIQMIAQVCRGLWAAHEQGLVHRDLKPSNLFVLSDDSIKIIDFGMAHLTNQHSVTGVKGTLPYMAPEQLQMKQQPTPLSDQFSLAVVCYEMLSRRHPFTGTGYEHVAQAILHYTPPPVSEINTLVSPSISQVIHKALAKEPFHRFADIRKFSEYLQKALRGEAIDIFDPARIALRVQQARKALDTGHLDDAAEIVTEMESEILDREVTELRTQIDAARRENTIKQLLDTARRRIGEEEYVRALQKVQEILNIDPTNTDAFTLKGAIESKRSTIQIEEWFRVAHQHMENHAYAHARQALEKVLDLRPKELRAQALLADVERKEQEHARLRAEKDQAYQSALEAYKRGDVQSAANKLEWLLDLDRRAPSATSPEKGAAYQKLYEEVCTSRDQLVSQEAEARNLLNRRDFEAAAQICDSVLAKYSSNIVFRVLRDDIEQERRLEVSAYVAKIEREVAAEPDLNRRVSILEEAKRRYAFEQRFEQSLQAVRARRDLVDSIAGRARTLEEQRQFSDALAQWQTLRNIHPTYPGLDIEIERLKKRREQQARSDAKTHWVDQIDEARALHSFAKAAALVAEAFVEFPDDSELAALDKQVQEDQRRALEAQEKAHRGKQLHDTGNSKAALELLRQAFQLDAHNPAIRASLIDVLLKEAGRTVDLDWRTAEPFVQETLDLDPNNPLAKSIGTLIQDKRQSEEVSAALSRARELYAQEDIKRAFAAVDAARDKYPMEPRLIQFRAALREGLSAKDKEELRLRDLDDLKGLVKQSMQTKDIQTLESIFLKSHAYDKYGRDVEFKESLSAIEERFRTESKSAPWAMAASVAAAAEGSAPAQSPPKLHDQPPPQQPAVETSVPPASKLVWRVPQAVWSTIGFAAVLLILAIVFTHQWNPPLATVVVSNARTGEYRILDSNSADVTNQAGIGLSAGNYRLVSTKTGFGHFEQSFSVDPSKQSRTVLTVQWQPLPVQPQTLPVDVRLALPRSAGTIKVDDAEQHPENRAPLRVEWTKGTHTIAWNSGEIDSVQVHFDVSEARVTIRNPIDAKGFVLGVVALLNKRELAYQAINRQAGVTAVINDQPDLRPTGKVAIDKTTRIAFQTGLNARRLGEFQADPSGPATVYLYLARQQPAPHSQATAPPKPDRLPEPIPEPPPQPPPQPVPVQEDPALKRARERCGARTKAGLPCEVPRSDQDKQQ